jgi:protein gp37
MAETQIEWTDSTWNPVAECSIITAALPIVMHWRWPKT